MESNGTDQVNPQSASIQLMTQPKLYKRHRFLPEIIQYAVWIYHRFNLSHRDVEDLLAERGECTAPHQQERS